MNLQQFFQTHPKAAVAFSGGVDSAYLLYAGKRWGEQVKAYFVSSAFQPDFEREDAERLARELGVELAILPLDVLRVPEIRENTAGRCYFCKRVIFNAIQQAARVDGYPLLLDGSNASDDPGDRPGMQALRELQVCSPLRDCGLTKQEIRRLSREAGLFTHDKPAYACLATRIPTGMPITEEKLAVTQRAEQFLTGLGLRDLRVRMTRNGEAKIQLLERDLPLLLQRREEIYKTLREDYHGVLLDLEVRNEH